MAERIAYYGNVQLGTVLVDIAPIHARGNQNIVLGIDQARAFVETLSPNFSYSYRVWTQEFDTTPANRSEEALQKANMTEMKALENLADDGALHPLCWIGDNTKTTTVSGAETAGSNVNVEIASLSALGAVANDYVLFVGASVGQCCLVASTATGPDKVVVTLTSNLAGGESVYLVSIYYPSCRYDGQDPGMKEPTKLGRVSFRKSYTFTSGSQPLWKA